MLTDSGNWGVIDQVGNPTPSYLLRAVVLAQTHY
jgi:hypothetical protein